MILRLVPLAVVLVLLTSCATGDERQVADTGLDADRDVRAALATQVEAWNRGDLDAFTSIYADDALFVTPDGVTEGRALVLERYRRRYPDGAAMGVLSLDVLASQVYSGGGGVQAVTVTAKWTLVFAEEADPPKADGHTLIVFRPRGDGWEIVRDASM